MNRYFALLIILCLISVSVFGLSMGPARVEYIYKPGLEGNFTLYVTENAGKSIDIVVYAEGELAEYVTINETNFHLEPGETKQISYSFSLPDELENYGRNEALIIAKTSIPQKERRAAVTAAVAIAHQFWVYVPYPYVYVEPRITTENVEIESVRNGDPVFIDITLLNLGSVDAETTTSLVVKDSEGRTLSDFDDRDADIAAGQKEILEYDWYADDVESLTPGKYVVDVEVEYGGDTKSSATADFKLGDVSVRPMKITVDDFSFGGIAKVKLEVESFWSDTIPGVYAKGLLKNSAGETIRNPAPSASIDIEPWDKRELDLFIDTEGLVPGTYDFEATVYFSQQESKETFDFVVPTAEESAAPAEAGALQIDPTMLAIIGVLVVIAVLLVVVVIVVLKRK